MTIARRIQVYGHVQGVGFRWHTCREAQRLGIVGWVRNRPDGSVEIHAQGSEDQVAALQAWAAHGPAHARVVRQYVMPCPIENLSAFNERNPD